MSEHLQSLSGGRRPPEIGGTQGADAPRSDSHEHTPGVAYEREEFNFRLILWVGAGLVVTALVVHVIVWWLFGGLEKHNTVPTGSVSELALEDASRPFDQRLDNVPAPHLEGIEPESNPSRIAAARQRAEVRMKRYGWIDRDKGIVHVPIEKAMEEVLKSKEFRTGDKQKKSVGRLALPSRSNSGREAAGGKR
ncbi:MAG TPA: hypothetical protein VMG10_36865 [Gemmataceae bacterium]|nr:hypothetical protein [Gemmataceae bacterium]